MAGLPVRFFRTVAVFGFLLRMRLIRSACIALVDLLPIGTPIGESPNLLFGRLGFYASAPLLSLQCPLIRNLFPAPFWMHSRIGNPSSDLGIRSVYGFFRSLLGFSEHFGLLRLMCENVRKRFLGELVKVVACLPAHRVYCAFFRNCGGCYRCYASKAFDPF